MLFPPIALQAYYLIYNIPENTTLFLYQRTKKKTVIEEESAKCVLTRIDWGTTIKGFTRFALNCNLQWKTHCRWPAL